MYSAIEIDYCVQLMGMWSLVRRVVLVRQNGFIFGLRLRLRHPLRSVTLGGLTRGEVHYFNFIEHNVNKLFICDYALTKYTVCIVFNVCNYKNNIFDWFRRKLCCHGFFVTLQLNIGL